MGSVPIFSIAAVQCRAQEKLHTRSESLVARFTLAHYLYVQGNKIEPPIGGKSRHDNQTLAPRFPQFGGRGRRIHRRVPRGRWRLGLLPAAAHAARPQLAALSKPKKVLILGAGISGLTAAYELIAQGLRRAGARSVASRRRPQSDVARTAISSTRPAIRRSASSTTIRICISTRARRAFPGHHRDLLDYCKELGVELAPFINDNRNAWVQDDAMFGGKPIRNREYITDTRGFIAELLAKSLKPEQMRGAVDDGRLRAAARVRAAVRRARPQLQVHRHRAARASRSHDYTRARAAQEAAGPSELMRSGFMLPDELRRDGRSGGDDDGAGRRHGPHRRGLHAQGRPPRAARIRRCESIRCSERGVEVTYRTQRRVRHHAGRLLPQLHSRCSCSPASSTTFPTRVCRRIHARFHAASCSRSACR